MNWYETPWGKVLGTRIHLQDPVGCYYKRSVEGEIGPKSNSTFAAPTLNFNFSDLEYFKKGQNF